VTIYNYQINIAGGNFEKVKQGPVELDYGTNNSDLLDGLGGRAKAAEERFNAVVAKYKRMVIL
jgi:hypothetical protein